MTWTSSSQGLLSSRIAVLADRCAAAAAAAAAAELGACAPSSVLLSASPSSFRLMTDVSHHWNQQLHLGTAQVCEQAELPLTTATRL